jgi:diguanylate cyclase (GGDEF)-like protein
LSGQPHVTGPRGFNGYDDLGVFSHVEGSRPSTVIGVNVMMAPSQQFTDCVLASRRGMMSEARHLASALLDVDTASDDLLRLDARLRLIWIEFQDGRHHAARSQAVAAIREANARDDLGRESRARSLYAHILAEDLETASATDEALRALQLARAAGDPVSMSAALIVPAIICSRLGLFDVAVELAEKAVVQAQLSGDQEAIAHCASNLGSLHADYLFRFADASSVQRRRYLDIAIEHTRTAIAVAKAYGDGERQRLPGYNLVEFSLLAGDIAGAERAMRDADAAVGVPSPRTLVQRGHVQALLLLELGDHERAIPALRESIDRCIAYPTLELAVFASQRLADVLENIGDFRGAYLAHCQFHALFCRHVDQDASRLMQDSIARDKIQQMRRSIAEAERRARQLAARNLQLARTRARAEQEMRTDALTGLGNRRRFDALIRQLTQEGASYVIAMADLDHFKTVNDRHGHRIGDCVLRRAAAIMRDVVIGSGHGQGLVSRIGGEEFAIVLPARSAAAGARDTCEKIRHAISSYPWGGLVEGLSVTITIGIGASEEAQDAARCLGLADERLYIGKARGRNCVV